MDAGGDQVDNGRCRTRVTFGGKNLSGDLPRGHGGGRFPKEIDRHPVAVGLRLRAGAAARRFDIADRILGVEQQEGDLDVLKVELGGPQFEAQAQHVGKDLGILGRNSGNPRIRHASDFTEACVG